MLTSLERARVVIGSAPPTQDFGNKGAVRLCSRRTLDDDAGGVAFVVCVCLQGTKKRTSLCEVANSPLPSITQSDNTQTTPPRTASMAANGTSLIEPAQWAAQIKLDGALNEVADTERRRVFTAETLRLPCVRLVIELVTDRQGRFVRTGRAFGAPRGRGMLLGGIDDRLQRLRGQPPAKTHDTN